MRAIGFYRYLPIEDTESLVDIQMATPLPVGRDLLVKVYAVSISAYPGLGHRGRG